MRVRAAETADLPTLLARMLDFNREEGIAWSIESGEAPLRRLLESPELGVVGLAERAGACVGYFVVCFSFDLEWGGRDAFLTELFVAPDQRGQGLGSRLLVEAERIARAHGVAALHLAVRRENASALRVYQAAGFADSGRVLYSKPLG
jgi:ribosomal protein S18 acetylase RimI-like enzyme